MCCIPVLSLCIAGSTRIHTCSHSMMSAAEKSRRAKMYVCVCKHRSAPAHLCSAARALPLQLQNGRQFGAPKSISGATKRSFAFAAQNLLQVLQLLNATRFVRATGLLFLQSWIFVGVKSTGILQEQITAEF